MSQVRVEREGGLARITLDRPPLNVLTTDMLASLDAALVETSQGRDVKVIALAGAGKAFSAGVDVAEHTAEKVERMIRGFHGVIRRLLDVEVPTVALVQGAALGGGAELALACDMVLARSDARLGLPEITLGVFPPVAAALLPRLVGRQRALELVLSGRVLTAEEAERMDLVSHSWPADRYEAEVRSWLAKVGSLSASSLRLAKRAVTAGLDQPFDQALGRAEDVYLGDLVATHDANEGIAAFLEKRQPIWSEG